MGILRGFFGGELRVLVREDILCRKFLAMYLRAASIDSGAMRTSRYAYK